MRAAALSASLLLSGVLASSHPISQEGAPEPPAARLERERDTDIEGRRGLSEILHDLDPLGHFGLEGGRGGRKSVHPLPRAAAAAAPAAPADKKKKEKSKHKHKHKHKAKPKPATTAPAATTTSAAAAASSTTAAAPAATTSAAPSPAEVQAQKDEATLQEVRVSLENLQQSFNTYIQAAQPLMSKACKAVDMADMGVSVAECNQVNSVQSKFENDLRNTLNAANIGGGVDA